MKNIKNLILLLFPTVNTSPPSISTHHLASFEQSVGHELSGSKSSRVSLRRERDTIYMRIIACECAMLQYVEGMGS